MYIGPLRKVPPDFNKTWIFSMSNFTKKLPVRAELFCANVKTDRQT